MFSRDCLQYAQCSVAFIFSAHNVQFRLMVRTLFSTKPFRCGKLGEEVNRVTIHSLAISANSCDVEQGQLSEMTLSGIQYALHLTNY